MFENLTIIAVLAISVWVISFLVYGYATGKQKKLEENIKALRDRLDKSN